MKRAVALTLVVLLVLSLCGCGSGSANNERRPAEVKQTKSKLQDEQKLTSKMYFDEKLQKVTRIYRYSYDEHGNLLFVLEYDMGRQQGEILSYEYHYNAKGGLVEKREYEDGELICRQEFNADGKLICDDSCAYGWAIEYEYDKNGQVLKETHKQYGEITYTVEMTYYKNRAIATRLTTYSDGTSHYLEYGDTYPVSSIERDASGNVTQKQSFKREYNQHGDLVKLTSWDELANKEASCTKYTYKYDEKGNKLYAAARDESGALTYEYEAEYNSDGNVVFSRSMDDSNYYYSSKTIYMEYNTDGNCIKRTVESYSGGSKSNLSYENVIREYDGNGNTTKFTYSEGTGWIEFYFDEDNRVVKKIRTGVSNYQDFDIKLDGDVYYKKEETDSPGYYDAMYDSPYIREYSYNEDNLLIQVNEKSFLGDPVGYWSYTYAKLSKTEPVTISDVCNAPKPVEKILYGPDEATVLKRTEYNDDGTISVVHDFGENPGAYEFSYEENEEGMLVGSLKLRAGEIFFDDDTDLRKVELLYDKNGQLVEAILYFDGRGPERYYLEMEYDKIGNITSQSYGYVSEIVYSYEYDENWRISKECRYMSDFSEGTLLEVINWDYDSQDRLIKKTHFNSEGVVTGYTAYKYA